MSWCNAVVGAETFSPAVTLGSVITWRDRQWRVACFVARAEREFVQLVLV